MPNNVPRRPKPPDRDDEKRVLHSAIRHRMLDGEWEEDGIAMLRNHVGDDRAEQWGLLDMSACPAKQISGQLAVLYIDRPSVTHAAGGEIDGLTGDLGLVRMAGCWTKMQEVQRYNWFLRDYFMRTDADQKHDQLTYRLVSPHNVPTIRTDSNQPDRPIRIEELRLRTVNDKLFWTYDILDISDEDHPIYEVILCDHTDKGRRKDITKDVLDGDFSNEKYPYRRADKTPVLPYTQYHARDTGRPWNAYDGVEVMIGSLNAAVYWTMAGHAAKDASGRTVVVVGADAQGVDAKQSPQTGQSYRTVQLEPGTVMFFEGTGTGEVRIQEVGPGGQIVELEQFAAGYEHRIAVLADINPSDIQKTADERSGFAIAVSNQGKREAQKKQTEIYRRYDVELLEKSAIISNRLLGRNFPESGYNPDYAPIPKSPEEQRSDREEIEFDLQNHVIAPWEVVKRRRPGISDDEAKRIYNENAKASAIARVQQSFADGIPVAK